MKVMQVVVASSGHWFIDQSSVHFMVTKSSKTKGVLAIGSVSGCQTIWNWRFQTNTSSNQSRYNQRRLTNLGTFRAYVEFYLRQHQGIAQNQTLLVRQLQPISEGLPLEIYAFTNTTAWASYETIQSDIFDHLIAIILWVWIENLSGTIRSWLSKTLNTGLQIQPLSYRSEWGLR